MELIEKSEIVRSPTAVISYFFWLALVHLHRSFFRCKRMGQFNSKNDNLLSMRAKCELALIWIFLPQMTEFSERGPAVNQMCSDRPIAQNQRNGVNQS